MLVAALILAMLIYCGTFLLGLGISLGWWRTRQIRWLHHALFAGIWVSLGLTALVAGLHGARWWWAPLVTLAWMGPLPRVRAGGVMHRLLATGGLVTLGAASAFLLADIY